MKRKSGQLDYVLFAVVVILIVLGVLILASASAPLAQERFGAPYYYLNRQILFGLIPGLILAFLAFKVRLDFLKKWAPVLLLINLLLLAMVFLPKIGTEAGGAVRWLNLGLFTFQPSEFLKLTLILYLAIWFSSRLNQGSSSKMAQKTLSFARTTARNKEKVLVFSLTQSLIPFLAMMGLISLFLILQPNVSTLGIIVLVAALMYFSAGFPLKHVFLIFLIGIGGLITLIKIAPYRLERLWVFLEPGIDPMGIGYQIKQAAIAIGAGGILGTGLGMGFQKFGFLPIPMSDSIFAIFAEETGFIGGLILISLFLIFLWRGFKISKIAQDKFSQLAALGISSWIVIQAFINISSMIGILPLTGIPLPFISQGGSHLIAELAGVGVLLNISKNAT